MTTLLFIHGTGVRETAYRATLDRITEKVAALDNAVTVRGCYWGSTHGALLRHELRSVPTYLDTGGKVLSEEEQAIGLWMILLSDPTYELRLLQLKPVGPQSFGPPPSARLLAQMKQFSASAELLARFRQLGLDGYLKGAVAAIAASPELAGAVSTAPTQPLEHRQAIARAIVAQTAFASQADGVPAIDGSHRDELVIAVGDELDAYGMGVGTWLKDAVTTIASHIVTSRLLAGRGEVTDAASPGAGDILRFLAYPAEVTALLHETVAGIDDDRVFLLGHSLGGIMSLDLLCRNDLSHVAGLITVGSQAPYLYEIGAFPALQRDRPLPATVPRWLNIYDLRDTLSYLGAPVFPERVTDIEVDNGQPFPQSHSAYWNTPETWASIKGFMA